MSVRFLSDTNVLVYAVDRVDKNKHDTARQILETALASGEGCISFQVAQEFPNVVTQKFLKPMSAKEAQGYVRELLVPLCAVWPSAGLLEQALDVKERWKFHFYDALIVAAALEVGCGTLYSEDMQHGLRIGDLTIENPFKT